MLTDNKQEIFLKNFENVDIFIYSHIPFRPITDNHIFKVLTNSHDEAYKFNTDLAIYRDYNGTNISDANLMYNEYCGFYWIWKNYPIKKYVGLNHYRRYYTNYNELPDIDEIFKMYPIILNKAVPLKTSNDGKTYTNREWYELFHNVEDFDLMGEIIKDKYPEYAEGFDKMANVDFINPSNLFTMTKDTFNEYCQFAFNVLLDFRKERGFFKVEDCIKYVEEHKDKYIKSYIGEYYNVEKQARIVGYLAERVLATFLWKGGKDSLMNHAKIFDWYFLEPKKKAQSTTHD